MSSDLALATITATNVLHTSVIRALAVANHRTATLGLPVLTDSHLKELADTLTARFRELVTEDATEDSAGNIAEDEDRFRDDGSPIV